MAKSRPVVSDTPGDEFGELRRQFNNLLLVLENVCAAVDAADITADEAFTVLATTLSAGVDSDITGVDGGANNYAGTGRECAGVKPTPAVRPNGQRALVDMDNGSDY